MTDTDTTTEDDGPLVPVEVFVQVLDEVYRRAVLPLVVCFRYLTGAGWEDISPGNDGMPTDHRGITQLDLLRPETIRDKVVPSVLILRDEWLAAKGKAPTDKDAIKAAEAAVTNVKGGVTVKARKAKADFHKSGKLPDNLLLLIWVLDEVRNEAIDSWLASQDLRLPTHEWGAAVGAVKFTATILKGNGVTWEDAGMPVKSGLEKGNGLPDLPRGPRN